MKAHERMYQAMNRLAKWRSILAGWQLGTRAKGDPESDAVRDHREVTLLLRAEVSALTVILIKAGVASPEEINEQMAEEAEFLSESLSVRFPGARPSDEGIEIDTDQARPWFSKFPP